MKALGATRGRAATLAASAQSAYRTGRSFDASAIRMSNVQQLPLFCNRRKAIGKRTSSYYARTSLDGVLPDAFDQRRAPFLPRACAESRRSEAGTNGSRQMDIDDWSQFHRVIARQIVVASRGHMQACVRKQVK